MGIADLASKVVGDKRRWRAYRARVPLLPVPYRTAVQGLELYLLRTGPGDADGLMRMLEDLLDLFEQSAAAGTPIREIVGEDPVEFAEEFKSNYGLGPWLSKEQKRLIGSIERAEGEQGEPS
jgi:DNA-binding ferritin-like protein (Dps family)